MIPSQDAGSMWTDWREDDPKLGRHRRETFVTTELAPVVEAGLNHTSKVGQGTVDLTVRIGGTLLEAGSRRCPEEFSAALSDASIPHTTDYLTDGTHD